MCIACVEAHDGERESIGVTGCWLQEKVIQQHCTTNI